jgi:tetratricopeptide (TPR) repeat protein
MILNRLDRSRESIELLTTASRELHAAGNLSRALLADNNLARSLMLTGRYDESQQLLEQVDRSWSENATANQNRLGDLARTRAELELARQHVNEAAGHIDHSLALLGYPSESNAFGLTAALTSAARIYLAKGELARAETFARDALRISEGLARDPAQSADVGEAALVLAALQRAKGDRAAARASVDRSVEALTNGLGSGHTLTREAVALQAALRQ